MNATLPETMNEIELFRYHGSVVHRIVSLNLEGFTQHESLIPLHPQGNCLNWIFGHLLLLHDQLLSMLGQKPVLGEHALRRFARGAPPLEDASEALDMEDAVQAWDEAAERLDAGLLALTAAEMDAPAPFSPTGDPNETVRSFLVVIFLHQAYHAGQIAVLRRSAGKAGVLG